MKQMITIRGRPVKEIYESFEGSYWFVTDRAWKQDSLFGGRIYKNDQILYGYVRMAHCPECAEFGYFSEAELRLLGNRVWKVAKQDWAFCPEVEVLEVAGKKAPIVNAGRVASPALLAHVQLTERRCTIENGM
jgi:hypothetical protein